MQMTLISLSEITAELFEKHRGEAFRLLCEAGELGAQVVDCELVEIRRAAQYARGATQREPFSILFRDREARGLAPSLYTLQHETFEVRNLYLSQVQLMPPRPDESGCAFYEAVIS
jgi:hypothetical protein